MQAVQSAILDAAGVSEKEPAGQGLQKEAELAACVSE
jgi:hypothetical protein